jgi:hypothetical protein
MSGHFSSLRLYDDNNTTTLSFSADQVNVTTRDGNRVAKKNMADFGLSKNCKVVLWGGCSVCSSKDTVSTLQKLFGPHVLLGYAGSTGAAITEALLGGGFIKKGHFFDNLKNMDFQPAAIRNAWLRAAINGYKGGTGANSINEQLFRAVDPDGREWFTSGGQIIEKKF